jgi:hypothetical protein
MRRALTAERGLTLVEVSMLMIATFAIVGALAPSMTTTIRHAEAVTANARMTDIANQLNTALVDMTFKAFTIDGVKNDTPVNLLVSDGDIPREVSATGSASWQAVVDNSLVDFLERHLVTNNPGGNAANAYLPPGINGWRGAYLNGPVDPDPWGNRYMVNAEFLGPSSQDVVVYSAGPDEQIDTLYSANPLAAGGDDVIVLVES